MGGDMRFRRADLRSLIAIATLIAFAVLAASSTHAQFMRPKKGAKKNQVQVSLDDYLASVRGRAVAKEDLRTTGSLWFPAAPMAETALDYKARHSGDLLIIRVVDNFSASSNGTGSQQRAFNASSGVSSFLGNLRSTANLQNLFSPTSSETLSGKGASTLASAVSLNLAGRVVEALPNGVLVVEAVRDLTVGNDRQTIVLHGLVRPGDIASDGSVLSTDVSNLEAQIVGKGLVADSIRQPNVVIRALLKVLNF